MRRNYLFLAAVSTALALGLSYLFLFHDPSGWLALWINPETGPFLFILFMLVLPVFGVSIVLFLVLAGVKFGAAAGLLVAAITMAVHLLATYGITHSLLKGRIDRLLRLENTAPDLPLGRSPRFAVVFMLVPGVPYAVKNYLLALSGYSLWRYFLIGWTTQVIMGIPLVVFGKALKQTSHPFIYLLLALLFFGLAFPWLRKRYFGRRSRAGGDRGPR